MITVIKHGNIKIKKSVSYYKIRCRGCGCEFSFNSADICHDEKEHDSWINCPECYLPIDILRYNITPIYES